MGERIIDSVDLAIAERTAHGSLSIGLAIVKLPAALEAAAEQMQQSGAPSPVPPRRSPIASYGNVALDLEASRAGFLFGTLLIQVWDDLDLYGLRLRAPPKEARPWSKVSLSDLKGGETQLDPDEDVPLIAVHAVNPTLVVDLIAGVLTGSIKHGGTEQVAGVATTRFNANFDLDKTTQDTREDDYDDDRREAIEHLFDVLKVKGRVHRGSVWLDADGLPRQMLLRLRLEPAVDSEVEVSLRLTLEKFGEPVTIEPPAAREWLEVSSVVGFLRTVAPQFSVSAQLEQRAQTGQAPAPPGREGPTSTAP